MDKYLINPNQRLSVINKDIYGHFSEHLGRCIYEGLFVGEDSPIPNVNGMRVDVVQALKEMGLPVLRWPGGCFADEYHWMDGIGEKSKRKKMINTHWGGVVEDNSFGTHEYFELCRQLGCDTYINGNVGSGSVREMNEWVEYMTFDGTSPMALLRRENGHAQPWKIKYFGVGNENWGCGGNMTPEYYANVYRRYQTYVRNYGDSRILKVACGPNDDDYNWTDTLMRHARHMSALSLHYYTVPNVYHFRGKALEFDSVEYETTVSKAYRMEELVTRHGEIMNRYDPQKRVALVVDEWGTWYDVEEGTNPGFLYQQNTMRDAIVAGLTLNIFNKHSDRVRMANIAQTVNVLQSVALTDGADMLLTPTYHIFKMYKAHQNNTLLGSYLTSKEYEADNRRYPQLVESASIDDNGVITATVVNTSETEDASIRTQVADFAVHSVKAEIVTGASHDYNSFAHKDVVKTTAFEDFTARADGFDVKIPACSVVKFTIEA